MALFPKGGTLKKEIESWNNFAHRLRGEDRELFEGMLSECYQYEEAAHARGQPFLQNHHSWH